MSFDVVSLLTKVPIDEALDVLALRLKEDNTLFERTAIPPEDIHCLAELYAMPKIHLFRVQRAIL